MDLKLPATEVPSKSAYPNKYTGPAGDTNGHANSENEPDAVCVRPLDTTCPGARTPIHPLDGTAPLTMNNFRLRFAPFRFKVEGKKGKVTVVNPVSVWVSHLESTLPG